MILNENDIYDRLESFRNHQGYSQEKMAELVGLSTKQAYSNMIKNRTMKFQYFINLINNTGLSANYFLDIASDGSSPESDPHKRTEDDCPECKQKDKVIEKLRIELNEVKDKYIHLLEKGDVKKETSASSSKKAG